MPLPSISGGFSHWLPHKPGDSCAIPRKLSPVAGGKRMPGTVPTVFDSVKIILCSTSLLAVAYFLTDFQQARKQNRWKW